MSVQKYGQQIRLISNQRYFITLHLPEEDFKFSFTSRYDPYYCPTRLVQGDLGIALKGMPVEDIAQMIWQVSQDIDRVIESEMSFPPDNIDRLKEQYVRYQSDYMLLLSVYTGRDTNLGQEHRKLRDLTITMLITPSKVEGLLDRWKQLADELLADILGEPVIGRSFLKASDSRFTLERRL